MLYEGDSKISLTVSGITEPVGPLARYDVDTQWWRVHNITESATHDPTNGIYSYLLPKYGKYAFLSTDSPTIVPVARAVTDINYVYFFTNIQLVRAEYSSAEIISLLGDYFTRVKNLSLKESISQSSSTIITKSSLQLGLTQTLTGLCVILPECQINPSATGLSNPALSS